MRRKMKRRRRRRRGFEEYLEKKGRIEREKGFCNRFYGNRKEGKMKEKEKKIGKKE